MITKAFSVYDSKATVYGVPFFMPTVGAAIRAFTDLTNDPQSMVFRHSGDFVLYQVGEFNDQTSELSWVSPAVHLGVASEFLDYKNLPRKAMFNEKNTMDMLAQVQAAVDKPLATAEELVNGGSK